MNKTTILFIAFTVSILFVSANAGPIAEEETHVEDKLDVEALSKLEEGLDDVTPYKSIFFGNNSKDRCWICLKPCDFAMCCDNNGRPRCCVIQGQCRCCRTT